MALRIQIYLLVLFGGVIAGLVAGVFSFTLGSFLIWGAITTIGLATLARWYPEAEIPGRLLALVWTVALIAFLVLLIF